MKRRQRYYSGSMSAEVTEREIRNRAIARAAAAEGMVLLKNEEDILPIREGQKVAIYGNGVVNIIKGGTGSGDVNEREVVSLYQGLVDDGIEVLNGAAVASDIKAYKDAQLAWRDMILDKMYSTSGGSDMGFFKVFISNPFQPPKQTPVDTKNVADADVCIYIISRVAGEGRDRFDAEGDYYLTQEEKDQIKLLKANTDRIVLLVNAGGPIHLTDLAEDPAIKAIVNVSQGGMEIGHAIADVLTGKVNPSGKLTTTWGENYMDYPNSATFSHNNGNTEKEFYEESIYIGYRYFDSFGVKPLYPFGFGLSYTEFTMKTESVCADAQSVTAAVTVRNCGKLAGKEVVQIYAAAPQEELAKEFKRLTGFGKTGLLQPGESQTLTIIMPAKAFASFDDVKEQWIVEKGPYAILIGNSSDHTDLAAVLEVAEDAVIEEVEGICLPKDEVIEILRPDELIEELTAAWKQEAVEKGMAPIAWAPEKEILQKQPEHALDQAAMQIAKQLTDEELTAVLIGEITKGQDNLKENELVTSGIYVPGAAGETTNRLEERFDVPAISMADGPAGLRVMKSYDVDRASGLIYSKTLMASLSGGLFSINYHNQNADTYYMYATAIPIGTLLAQSWDPALLESIGAMVGEEMIEFGISWWLAPGMNIHRNPLCGRNFEYYSEDPLVAGMMAAAITRGVQSQPGVGTTIKHFACNNQEDNRMFSDSILSERALREIYLKGFEIAIKTSQPMCIMTGYNLLNGVPTANNYDIITEAARKEWDFQGIVMTDWTPTTEGCASSYMCAVAGNDLIMPGNQKDVDDVMEKLADGRLPRATAEACAARMIRVIWQTLGMEDAPAYGAQYPNMPYIKVK